MIREIYLLVVSVSNRFAYNCRFRILKKREALTYPIKIVASVCAKSQSIKQEEFEKKGQAHISSPLVVVFVSLIQISIYTHMYI